MKKALFHGLLAALLTLLHVPPLIAQPHGLDSRPAFGAFLDGRVPEAAPVFSGDWSAVIAFPNITFLNPMGLLPMPGSSNLVVWEREGRIYYFTNTPAVSTKTLILDISRQVQGWDDSGLMGIAFHPGFATNRYLFIYYTYVTPGTVQGSATGRPPTDTPNRDRLSRITLDDNGVAVPGSETIFIDQRSETVWHNGGGMFFHPQNGFLYLTNGDDARGGNNQRINVSLHSGVLRLDVDQRGGGVSHPIPRQPQPAGSVTANYYIPNDNPFVGQAGVLEEFFAIGLRSPHRMTIDPPTGRIFIGDVGDGAREEIDVIEPNDPLGLNFQWNRIEGRQGDLVPPFIGVNRRPILDYPHSEGAAVIGGYVYRGGEFAADLGGRYIFGDNIANVVWILDESTVPASKHILCTMPRGSGPNAGNDYVGLSSFGYDHENELYMCQLSSLGGHIYKFQRGGTHARPMPRLLSETGVFTDPTNLTVRTGLVHYTLNAPFWSDRAVKSRWMGIPDGKKIGFSTNGEWTFPEGSVWVKHFDLPTNLTNPAVRRRLETRLLVRDTNGYVYGGSYRWRADNSDAELVTGAITENVPLVVAGPVGELSSLDIGGPVAGSTVRVGDGYRITAGGADIWGTADQFRFAHQQRTGDFDITVRVASLVQSDLYTKAGLMVRDSLAPEARHIFALVFPSNASRNNNVGGYEFQSRDTVGGNAAAIYPPNPQPRVAYPNTWLRLKRAGNTFTAYSSNDGEEWQLYATKVLALPQTVYFGLAATAHTGSGATTTAEFYFQEQRMQPWYFPSRQDCISCHTRAAGGVLGVKTRQSNLDHLFAETGITDNQLRAWNHVGYFEPAVDEAAIPSMPRLVAVTTETADLEFRARSYLDSNCSHCHRPGGVRAAWDARIETPLGMAVIVGGAAADMLGVPGSQIIVARDLSRSVLYRRVATATEPFRMPPVGKNVVDQAGVSLISEWIQSLTPPPAVAISAPTAGSFYYGPLVLTLNATASSANGDIVKVEYYSGETKLGEATRAPYQFVWEAGLGSYEIRAFATDITGQTGQSAIVPFTVIGASAQGLLGEYFDNMNLTARRMVRFDPTVNFDWGTDSPGPLIGPDSFSVRWTGQIRPRFSQTYTFTVTADDGVRLWVDGRLIVDQWIDQSPTSHSGTIALQAGRLYTIRMEMYENGGGAVARLEWASTGQGREVVPASALFPPASSSGNPTIALSSPLNGDIFRQPAVLDIVAVATDSDGTVARVEYFADGTRLGQTTASPHRWRWTNAPVGIHALYASATDDVGLITSSPISSITIQPLELTLPARAIVDGRFHFAFAATSGQRYRIESSTNLVDWSVVETQTAENGGVEFSEPVGQALRFYRSVPEP
jgi:glucose/arabinose dehydrogenase/regulation of enolase protein 1 (concanavalin A-like superfamily)